MSGDDTMSTGKALGLAAIVLSVVAGSVSLAFELFPDLKPCIGGDSAKFTGAPVFPHTSYHAFLERINTPKEDIAEEDDDKGAEIRFSFSSNGLRGEQLTVKFSVLRVKRDGSPGGIVSGQDRADALSLESEHCSEERANDLFVRVPSGSPDSRYRVVLELFEGKGLDRRLALTQTEVFRG